MSCEHHHGAGEAPAAAFDSNLRIAHQRHSLAKARGPPNRQARCIRSALIRSSSAWRRLCCRPCRRPSLTPCDRGSRGPDPCWCAGAGGESADGFALPFRRRDEGDLLAATAAAIGRSSRRRDEHRWRRSKRVDHGPSSGCQCSAPLRPPDFTPGNGIRNGAAARARRGDQRVRRAAVVRAGSAFRGRRVDQCGSDGGRAAAGGGQLVDGRRRERVGRDVQRDAVEVPVTENLDRLAGTDGTGLHQIVDAHGAP
jgi:hypothetical protein